MNRLPRPPAWPGIVLIHIAYLPDPPNEDSWPSKIPCSTYPRYMHIQTHEDSWGHMSKPEKKLIVPNTEERKERTPGHDTQVPAFLILGL